MKAVNSPARSETYLGRQRPAVTVALGLAAGALGWSGLAHAASEEAPNGVLLSPDHYRLMDDGVVVFKLENGEAFRLTAEQYLIMNDGLLLITDELAQASFQNFPVMGMERVQLLSDTTAVMEATPAQALSIEQGTAPRLSADIDFARYDIAQAAVVEPEDSEASKLTPPLSAALPAIGLTVFAARRSEAEAETSTAGTVTPTPSSATTPPSTAPSVGGSAEFRTDAMVNSATSINGGAVDYFLGYTAASTQANLSLLTSLGSPHPNQAIIDLSGGGDNYVRAGSMVAGGAGYLNYTGGPGIDDLSFTNMLAYTGTATFSMGAGGLNTFVAGTSAAISAGFLTYSGGAGTDDITIGDKAAANAGNIAIDLGLDTVGDTVKFQGSVGQSNDTVSIQNFDASDGDEIILIGQSTGSVDYSVVNVNDVEVSAPSGTATVVFTIRDTTVAALTSAHFDSTSGLVIS